MTTAEIDSPPTAITEGKAQGTLNPKKDPFEEKRF